MENPLGTFLSPIHILSNCQVSEKLEERAQRYFPTDGRAGGHDSLGLKQLHQETKKALGEFFCAFTTPN